jgi:alginate O-acetyltransferase complex protein AlgJ
VKRQPQPTPAARKRCDRVGWRRPRALEPARSAALIAGHRRYFGAIVATLLTVLMSGALVPDPMAERRPLALSTDAVSLSSKLGALPDAVSAYFADNLGYAGSMPFLRGVIEYAFDTSSDPGVYIGRHAHLYYTHEIAIFRRSDGIRHFVDMADALRGALSLHDGHLLVLSPPDSQSIAKQDLPSWWDSGGPFEYDLAMHELQKRGIAMLDLKAALAAMPDADELYRRTDSHWRWKGALLAFNMAMNAIGHDEWRLDPETSLSPLGPAKAGDLARMLGLQDYLSDDDQALRLAPVQPAWHEIDMLHSPPYEGVMAPYAFERRPGGVRILVLGDSSTAIFWRPLLLHSGAARIGWLHHGKCGFDFADVARFQPSDIILAATERILPCEPDAWPRGLPHEATTATR